MGTHHGIQILTVVKYQMCNGITEQTVNIESVMTKELVICFFTGPDIVAPTHVNSPM